MQREPQRLPIMAHPPPPCYLLDKLPPELRNRIYEFVFTFDHITDDHNHEIDVCTAIKSLPKALLFTCRTIQAEATKMFKAELNTFWSTHNFIITDSAYYHGEGFRKPDLKVIQKLTDDDIRYMNSLRFDRGARSVNLVHNQGGLGYGDSIVVPGSRIITQNWFRPRYFYSVLGYRYIDQGWESFDSEQELYKACEENEMEVPLLDQLCWLVFDIGGYREEYGGRTD